MYKNFDDYEKQLDFEETMCKVSHNMYYEGLVKEAEKELELCCCDKERELVIKEINHLKSQMI